MYYLFFDEINVEVRNSCEDELRIFMLWGVK